jgi:catechol-2,3-dioxygenase
MKIDHIAFQVDNPSLAAEWYSKNFDAKIVYSDETWSFIEFENIKMAFVMQDQHPVHIAFEDPNLKNGKKHRDGSVSIYKKDPFGNFYEIIKYPEKK